MLKTTLLFALVAVAFSAPLNQEESQSLWTAYKQTYSKSYAPSEEAERFTMFQERVKLVEEHNARFAKGLASFSIELNENADKSAVEMMHRNGYRQSDDQTSERVKLVSTGALPAMVDWRDKGAVTGIKDQGQCGSCWSFGTTGTLEGQWFLKYNTLISLSEQNLVDCDTSWDAGCNGGLPTYAYKYIMQHGIDTEASYPYHPYQGKCKFNAANVGANMTSFKQIASNDEDALKTAVAMVGPIAVGIDASHFSFQLYSGGVYDEPACSSTRLDHAVLVIGYGTTADGKDYWLVKNSWGTSWGMKGYIMMSRNNKNQCGIAHDASYPVL